MMCGKYSGNCGMRSLKPCAVTLIKLLIKRNHWNFRKEWKIYLADFQLFSKSVPPTRTHCVGGFCFLFAVPLHRRNWSTVFFDMLTQRTAREGPSVGKLFLLVRNTHTHTNLYSNLWKHTFYSFLSPAEKAAGCWVKWAEGISWDKLASVSDASSSLNSQDNENRNTDFYKWYFRRDSYLPSQ